jgi:hypothetical protein
MGIIMIELRILIILVFSGVIILSTLFMNSAIAQQPETSTYEGTYLGIKFSYPSSWTINQQTTSDGADCLIFCHVSFHGQSTGVVPISVKTYDLDDPLIQKDCRCSTLKEFVQYSYGFEPSLTFVNVIRDTPVSILGNHSAWEMESEPSMANTERKFYTLWTINEKDNMGYLVFLAADAGDEYDRFLPAVKEMINSIGFFTPTVPPSAKVPSFMIN